MSEFIFVVILFKISAKKMIKGFLIIFTLVTFTTPEKHTGLESRWDRVHLLKKGVRPVPLQWVCWSHRSIKGFSGKSELDVSVGKSFIIYRLLNKWSLADLSVIIIVAVVI